jgi:hypothetical protein
VLVVAVPSRSQSNCAVHVCGRVEPRSEGAQAVPRWAGQRTQSVSEILLRAGGLVAALSAALAPSPATVDAPLGS